jgi:hypothetical protein
MGFGGRGRLGPGDGSRSRLRGISRGGGRRPLRGARRVSGNVPQVRCGPWTAGRDGGVESHKARGTAGAPAARGPPGPDWARRLPTGGGNGKTGKSQEGGKPQGFRERDSRKAEASGIASAPAQLLPAGELAGSGSAPGRVASRRRGAPPAELLPAGGEHHGGRVPGQAKERSDGFRGGTGSAATAGHRRESIEVCGWRKLGPETLNYDYNLFLGVKGGPEGRTGRGNRAEESENGGNTEISEK